VRLSLRLTKNALTSCTTIVLQDRGCSGAETVTLMDMMPKIWLRKVNIYINYL